MTQAQVKREVESIKQRLMPKEGKVDLSNLTELEDRIITEAAEVIKRLRERNAIVVHARNIEVTCSDEEHDILKAAVVVLKRHTT